MKEKISLALDLNVLLDVVQRRQPFYEASAAVLSMALSGDVRAFVPAHVFTTLYYVVRKVLGRETAETTIDRLLSGVEVAPSGRAELQQARSLVMSDFEDAVVACAAKAAGCAWIVTRNEKDFSNSPVTAISPAKFLGYAAREPLIPDPE